MEQQNRQAQRGMSIRPFLIGSLGAAYYWLLRPNLMHWGTQFGEEARQLPGDHLILNPNSGYTHAIDIDASPRAVWAWLAQMGRDNTGFYNFDALSNGGVPSANYLRRDLAPLEAGTEWDNGLKVLSLEQYEHLVVGDFSRAHHVGGDYDLTLLFYLQALVRNRTRLIARLRRFAPGINGAFYNLVQEPFDFAQSIAQLKNLKQLAESSSHLFEGRQEHPNGNLRVKAESQIDE